MASHEHKKCRKFTSLVTSSAIKRPWKREKICLLTYFQAGKIPCLTLIFFFFRSSKTFYYIIILKVLKYWLKCYFLKLIRTSHIGKKMIQNGLFIYVISTSKHAPKRKENSCGYLLSILNYKKLKNNNKKRKSVWKEKRHLFVFIFKNIM